MADHSTKDIICRYLQDATAAERSFEDQLRGFAKEAADSDVRALFEQHADDTRVQYQRLTARLEALGESPSTMKSAPANMFSFAPKSASLGQDEAERQTQNLV